MLPHDSIATHDQSQIASSAVEGTPRLTQGMEQAVDVQMADVQVVAVQSDLHPPSERVPCRASLQVLPTAFPAMVAPMKVENGQPMQIDLATPSAGQAWPQDSAEAPDPTAVFTLPEELLVLATSLPANAYYQTPAARPEAKEMHSTQETFATSHALPSPMDLAA